MKRMSRIMAMLAAAAVLAGCNTVHGMGRDITRAGEVISGAAK
ncbi:MAG: entericidin A/B family lipoprotein [Burkholderiales bacterium]|nr:entericidin A/B family lipoprotein [Burkholderiales bacterium]MCH2240514.1 entericidin A/B family lipoprotein [Aquabacterium sp.]